MKIIVTGVPRSGTSMTMRILEFGGIPCDYDADVKQDKLRLNPHGFYEKRTTVHQLTGGHAIKMMAPRLAFFMKTAPVDDYRVILPMRDEEQINLSRAEAAEGKFHFPGHPHPYMGFKTFRELKRDDMRVLELPYDGYFTDSRGTCQKIADFLGTPFDVETAVTAIDPTLYKVRQSLTQGSNDRPQ